MHAIPTLGMAWLGLIQGRGLAASGCGRVQHARMQVCATSCVHEFIFTVHCHSLPRARNSASQLMHRSIDNADRTMIIYGITCAQAGTIACKCIV